MPFHSPDIGRNNPFGKSLYNEDLQEGIVSPGSPRFLITEDGLFLITENDLYIVTEN